MNLTKIDWLKFRTKAEPYAIERALRGVYAESGHKVRIVPRKTGYMGYERSAHVCLGDTRLGLWAEGGDSQLGWRTIELTGVGCQTVPDWVEADEHLTRLTSFERRRVDICLDTYKREVTYESVVDAYRQGLFRTGGAPPSMLRIEPEILYEGRTASVGKRGQAKYFRGYEKGFELLKNFPATDRQNIIEIDGVPVADIFRLELELNAKNVALPLDIIDNRDQYFAGAYPYLQRVIDVEPEVWRQSRDLNPRLELRAAAAQVKFQYGTLINTILLALGGDVGATLDMIRGDKVHEQLLAAGVCDVDHI